MAPLIRIRPSFPHSQSLPSGSFHKPLILIHREKTEWNHNHRKLTKVITWTTALSNSMKLWGMLCRATQDGQIMVENSDKTWSTGEGNGKPLQYSCLEQHENITARNINKGKCSSVLANWPQESWLNVTDLPTGCSYKISLYLKHFKLSF